MESIEKRQPMALGARVGKRRQFNMTPSLFLLPALLILFGVVLFPILNAFVLSFFRYQLNMPGLGIKFVGLANYAYIFQDKEMLDSVTWTLEFAAVVVTVELVVGMIFALVLNSQVLGKLREPLRAVFLVPIMLSGVVSGLMWRLLFDPEFGPVNHLMSTIGVGMVHWGSEVATARLMVIITDIWLATPFCMLVLLAGMQGISQDYIEAAAIDGASTFQTFTYITLPLLRFPIMVVLVTRSMDALRAFDMIYTLTGGGPGASTSTVMYYNYRYAFAYFQMGRATAMSIVFALLIFAISFFMMRLLRRDVA
ncbi:MAG: sugar ABC transporter permease [Caldilineaceae bacterium]